LRYAQSQARIFLKKDFYRFPGKNRVEFKLIYVGPLYGASRTDTRSKHKHDIRRVFHCQLRKLWDTASHLREWTTLQPFGTDGKLQTSVVEQIANKFSFNNYRFVPLSTTQLELGCSLDILFLRYDQPGQTLIQSGDIDNRIKTIFDALRIPKVGEYCGEPQVNENPFFCLLEDDSLIAHLSVATDVLLEPDKDVNDVHLILTVKLWPISVTYGNVGFGSHF
jgi:hypothetical protein